jgi:large subunit ribosomal protein L1
MGKIRTRIIGDESVEKKQKEEQKRKSTEKKQHKIRAQGLKGGERMKQIEVSDDSVAKMDKAKKLIESKPSFSKASEGKEKAKKLKKKVRGQNYKKSQKLVDSKKTYTLDEAVKLLKKMKSSKFDESVELHLNVDSTGLKGEVALPHSTGKTTRIKIVDDKVLEDIGKGKLEFDILITHPQYMPKLARFAKLLGPKGLMPNPKAGTISPKPEEVAKKFQKGTLRWKTEPKFPLIHQMIGKISLEEKALMDNVVSFLSSVGKSHIQAVFIKTTMSPSVKININTLA